MPITFPPELAEFVQHEMATGQYASETELLVQALKVYRELKQRHQELRDHVQRSIEQAENGQLRQLDTEATKSEARRRFAGTN